MSHNNDTIYRQAAIDAHCELCGDRYKCNSDICPDVEVFQLIPAVQSEPQWIPEVMAIPADDDRVSLSETVTATYYNEENEEWSRKSVTIRDVLDSVCDEYTVLPYAQPERKKGKWVGYDSDWLKTMCKCSECGAMIDINEKYRNFFCYHCGADMRGEQE